MTGPHSDVKPDQPSVLGGADVRVRVLLPASSRCELRPSPLFPRAWLAAQAGNDGSQPQEKLKSIDEFNAERRLQASAPGNAGEAIAKMYQLRQVIPCSGTERGAALVCSPLDLPWPGFGQGRRGRRALRRCQRGSHAAARGRPRGRAPGNQLADQQGVGRASPGGVAEAAQTPRGSELAGKGEGATVPFSHLLPSRNFGGSLLGLPPLFCPLSALGYPFPGETRAVFSSRPRICELRSGSKSPGLESP